MDTTDYEWEIPEVEVTQSDVVGKLKRTIRLLSSAEQAKLLHQLHVEKQDARSFPRKSMKVLVEYADENRAYQDYARDLSGSGMFIETQQKFKQGQVLNLLFVPEHSSLPVKTKAFVVRNTDDGIGVSLLWTL